MKLISNIKRKTYIKWKALVFSFFIALFFPFMANAQYGIKVGSSLSSFYYTGNVPIPYNGYDVDLRPYLGYDVEIVQTNPQKPLLSTYISVFRRFNLRHRLGFQPGLSFSQKGVDFSSSKYENIKYKVKINYLEIPFSLYYQYLSKEKVLSNFYFGGYGAYKINAIKKVAYYNRASEIIKLNSVEDLDFGVHAGIDFKYRFNKHYLLFDMRLFLGLNDIFFIPENWTNIYYDSQQTKITGINLSIGYEI